jgi:hypothetical protein
MRRAVLRQAEREYLLGHYGAVEALLHPLMPAPRNGSGALRDRVLGRRARALLALVRYQRNEYARAAELRVRLPIVQLMRAFGAVPPYQMSWSTEPAHIPFVEAEPWELPRVAIEVDGMAVEAQIDTGGDLLTLGAETARAVGVETVATMDGIWAGGKRHALSYGRVGSVHVGDVTVTNVPVTIAGNRRPIIGTGFLRQFLPTLDYPGRRLILRPRACGSGAARGGVAVPFRLALTHLILARGSLEARDGLTFLVDSGLEHETGAAFTAPARTLRAAGIAVPATQPEQASSGAGETTLELGHFPIARLGLGGVLGRELTGVYGAFPKQLRRAAGFPIHGLVSHGFLRRYAWTIDFDSMTMTFRDGQDQLRGPSS